MPDLRGALPSRLRAILQDRRVLAATVTSGSALIQKISGLVYLAISTPIAHQVLGTRVFALWVAATSYMSLMSFLDFGVGNGLVNAVAQANGRGDVPTCRRYLGAAICLMSLAGLAIAAIGLLGLSAVLVRVRTSPAEHSQALALGLVLVCTFSLNVPLSAVARAQFALQRGYQINLLNAASQLLATLMLVLLSRDREPTLPFYIALCGWPVLAGLLNAMMVRATGDVRQRPAFSGIDGQMVRGLIRTGSQFIAFQIGLSVLLLGDNVLVGLLLGHEALAQYAVAARLYGALASISALFLMPYWPALRDAVAAGDLAWAARTFWRSFWASTLIGGALVACVTIGARTILVLWMGRTFEADQWLVVGLAVWTLLYLIQTPVSIALNAMGRVVEQAAAFCICAIVVSFAKLITLQSLGVNAVGWLNAAGFLVLVVVPLGIVAGRVQRTGALS